MFWTGDGTEAVALLVVNSYMSRDRPKTVNKLCQLNQITPDAQENRGRRTLSDLNESPNFANSAPISIVP